MSAVGVRLRPSDAAAIAREVALRTARGDLPGIPSPHVIRLEEDGEIQIEGPVASGREIERAARLLESLLPGFDVPSEIRVPGAMRLVIARALRVLDLPPFESLDAFAEALSRFTVEDSRTVVVELVGAWRVATRKAAPPEPAAVELAPASAPVSLPEPAELTISDIRRARRATRLTLSDISERSRIPVELLREFEWGYLANWPTGFYGRTQIVRYARAAGLDERIVVRVAVPLLEQWDRVAPVSAASAERVEAAAVEAVPVEAVPVEAVPVEAVPVEVAPVEVAPVAIVPETRLVRVDPSPLVAVPHADRSRRKRWAVALAIPAMLAVGVVPAFWITRNGDEADARPAQTQTAASTQTEEATASPTAGNPERSVPAAERAVPVPLQGVTSTAFSPAFATAGSAVFYHSGTGPRSAIMKADTDGAGSVLRVTRVVDDDASNFHARPSPDGSLIAFDSDRDGVRGVYVADADGTRVRRVSGDGFAAVPSWSPDGHTLAFVRAEEGRPSVWNIWTLDLENGTETRITSHKVGSPWGAAWFPDGKLIAYSHETRLIVRALDGSRQSVFDSPVRGRLVRTPAVSPDGRRVIFQVYRDGGWVLDVATGRMKKVLADPTAEEFTWSPDGRRVAYHSRRSGKWGVQLLDATVVARSTRD